MELLVQQCIHVNFIDARAYMEISDALHQFVFRMLSVKEFTHKKLMSVSEMRCIHMRIVRLLPRECPFVYQASGSPEQARIECTWSPFFRAPPSRASPSIIPDGHIASAIKNTCYCCLHALYTNAQVEEWLALFTWLFTRAAVQSFIASPAILLYKSDYKDEEALAAAIASCLSEIHPLITRITEDKSNEATSADYSNDSVDALPRTYSSYEELCNILKTGLTKLLLLFNVSKRVLRRHLTNLRKTRSDL